MNTTDTLEEARRILQRMLELDCIPASSVTRAQAREWLAANAPKPPMPRRASVAHENGKVDPWGYAWPIGKDRIERYDERVEMIELTPQVIAALREAGIEFEDSGKLYQITP